MANVYAIPEPPQPNAPVPLNGPGGPNLPLDNNLDLFIILAIAYGLYVVYSRRKVEIT